MRPYADNVWLRLLPLEKTTASGLVLVEGDRKQKGTRRAQVIASGRGYVTKLGAFVENEIRVGETVHVYALAGQDWQADFDPPRHRERTEFEEFAGERAEHRVVRAEEILAVENQDGSLRALGGHAIVRRSDAARVSAGGIHIPEEHAPRPVTGTVVSVGQGRIRENGKRSPMEVTVGDVVMFGRFNGTEIEASGEKLLVLREDNILAVADEATAKAVEAA